MNEGVNRLAVVTVTYNSAQVIEDFLRSISHQSLPDFRLYAVDNASADDTVKRLQAASKAEPRITIVANSENVGVAEGNNQGIRLALEEGYTHVLLLNNDTTFPPELFASLMDVAVSGTQLVVVPKIYYYDEPRRLWFAGGWLARWRGYVGLHLGDGELDEGQFDLERSIEYSPTCCMLIAMSVFSNVGLMDARYFVYYDDTDFCLRLSRASIPIWYTPRAYLYHKVGSLTGGELSAFGARMSSRNKIYYLKKNFGLAAFLYFSSAYCVYLIMRWVLRRDSWDRFKLRAKALAEGLKM